MMLATMLLAFAAPALQAGGDPLAPARAGKIRCVSPDRAKRNCATIIRYSLRGDGGFDATVTGLVRRDPAVLLEYRMNGTVEGDAVCAVVRAEDFHGGRLFKDGAPLAPGPAATLRAQIRDTLQPLAGHKRCFRDSFDGDEVRSAVTIDGTVRSDMTQRVAWIDPDEGYAVGE